MKITIRTILKILTVSLILSVAIANADTIKKIDFETIDKGVYSQYEENNKQHVIEIYNQNDWQTFWNKHTNGTFPPLELPKINFQKYFIVIAIDEIRNSGGYTLEIKDITIDTAFENRPFGIILKLKQPGSAATTTAALTRPYHIVKIKK